MVELTTQSKTTFIRQSEEAWDGSVRYWEIEIAPQSWETSDLQFFQRFFSFLKSSPWNQINVLKTLILHHVYYNMQDRSQEKAVNLIQAHVKICKCWFLDLFSSMNNMWVLKRKRRIQKWNLKLLRNKSKLWIFKLKNDKNGLKQTLLFLREIILKNNIRPIYHSRPL